MEQFSHTLPCLTFIEIPYSKISVKSNRLHESGRIEKQYIPRVPREKTLRAVICSIKYFLLWPCRTGPAFKCQRFCPRACIIEKLSLTQPPLCSFESHFLSQLGLKGHNTIHVILSEEQMRAVESKSTPNNLSILMNIFIPIS